MVTIQCICMSYRSAALHYAAVHYACNGGPKSHATSYGDCYYATVFQLWEDEIWINNNMKDGKSVYWHLCESP